MRAFIAVPVSASLALELLALRDELVGQLRATEPRPVPAANFHLTLAFLGNIEAGQVDQLDALLTTVANQCTAFQQSLNEVAAFPSATGRLLAAQGPVRDDLRVLSRKLGQRLRLLGLGDDSDQALRPHITLARMRVPVVPPVRRPCALHLAVNALVLFESVRRQGRPVYRPLRRAELMSAAR